MGEIKSCADADLEDILSLFYVQSIDDITPIESEKRIDYLVVDLCPKRVNCYDIV